MSSTTMHFGPEWMRTKQNPTRPQAPPSPPPNTSSGASTYSALLSPAPPQQPEKRDETHPFRYSREELLRIYREGGGKGTLGLEVERWEGVVREVGTDPIGLRDMGDAEKKLFQGPLNSDLRRRQSSDLLSPLTTQGLGNDRSRHNLNSPSSAAGSPMRDRFGSLRRDQPSLAIPRKQSLSNLPPASPRDVAPSPRRGSGFTSGFDGILGGSDSWVARRRASEASLKANTGTSREVGGTDHPPERKASDIREEEEGQANEDRHVGESCDPEHTTTQHAANDPSLVNGAYPTAEMPNASLNVNGSGAPAPVNGPPSTSPAASLDLASVEWSYKDPSGQIQGPFNAELMQKWFEDGYFTGNLPVKRTHLDTHWATVDELVRRHGGTKIFVAPPLPVIPPGLPLHRDPQNVGQDPLLFSGPYQPAPIRNLRSSTLDSFGSNPSDSPSSSFGAGRFGNGSPDPNAFGGRGAFYGDNANRGPSYGGLPDPSNVFNRRSNFNDASVDPSFAMRTAAFSNVINRGPIADGFGYNRTYSPSQGWNAGPLDGNRSSIDSVASPFGPTSTNLFGPPQDVYGDASFPNGNYNSFVNGPSQPQHYAPSPASQYQQPASNSYGLQASTPQTISSDIHPSPAPPQSPWSSHEAPVARRPGPFDSAHPTASNTVVIPPTVESSPWGPPSEPSRPSSQANETSPWQPPSDEVVEDWKATAVPDSLTFSNLGQHNEQQQQLASAKEQAAQRPEPSDSAIVTPAVEVETAPEPTPKATTSSKSKSKTPSAQPTPAVKAPEAPALAEEVSPITLPAASAPKAPWAKEDEGKAKPSGISISLRDIQEDEAKKAEARKAAERERERVARAAAPAVDNRDANQSFTASWGLPTSQTGSRPAASAKETTAPPAVAPVWTNAAKVVTAKKTMKEIQEEEERRKKIATKETVASAAARRIPADTAQKLAPTPPVPQAGGAWTTIGANGKHNTASLPARPSVAPPTAPLNVPATARPKTNAPAPRPASVSPAIKAAALSSTPKDEVLIPPSSEFMKWLSTFLKGLNNSVNVDEIMEMLISFPIDADQATTDIVADIIYSNSTTLDGRRFAAEFFTKRKSDAAARPNGATAGKSATKPVSIADVVKATPKPAQPEWGFKVVNKKKKGGRA